MKESIVGLVFDLVGGAPEQAHQVGILWFKKWYKFLQGGAKKWKKLFGAPCFLNFYSGGPMGFFNFVAVFSPHPVQSNATMLLVFCSFTKKMYFWTQKWSPDKIRTCGLFGFSHPFWVLNPKNWLLWLSDQLYYFLGSICSHCRGKKKLFSSKNFICRKHFIN
jgi:hypothetical protein